jgi:hypothetical protein
MGSYYGIGGTYLEGNEFQSVVLEAGQVEREVEVWFGHLFSFSSDVFYGVL